MNGQDLMDGAMETGAAGVTTKGGGMLNSIKENLNVTAVVEKIKSSKDRIIEVGLYAGIGFISGFLLKKYSSYVGVVVLAIIGLGVLNHLGVLGIVINWDRVTEVFGIQAAQNVSADNIIATAWEWVRLNMVISISYIVGLFVGLKVG